MPSKKTHFNHAQALYRQRLSWMNEPSVDMTAMLSLERRLRIHLHVLASMLDEKELEQEPDQAPDAFILLATCFTSDQTAFQNYAAEMAVQWLADQSPRSHAAKDALTLFSFPVVYKAIQDAYLSIEEMRPVLLNILAHHNVAAPGSLKNISTIENEQSEIFQEQILYYALNKEASNENLFKSCYAESSDSLSGNHRALLYAIWGGLIRGQREARSALLHAIEKESDDLNRLELARVAAITGDEQFFPLLEVICEQKPEYGYALLALNGSGNAVDKILSALQHPRDGLSALTAWWWVSGQHLTTKPRLAVVGDESFPSDSNDQIPDVDTAHAWWGSVPLSKKNSVRWFRGQPIGTNEMINELKKNTGLMSQDVFDLLMYIAQKPVPLILHGWHENRLMFLDKLEQDLARQNSNEGMKDICNV